MFALLRPGRLAHIGTWFPSSCAVCGRWPSPPSGEPVCHDCWRAFAPGTTRCPTCALALPPDEPACAACSTAEYAFRACFAAVDYTYPWRDLLHRFKFASQPAWSRWFASMMWDQPGLRDAALACDWWLPIPLSHQRLAQRGYNQSWELTHALWRQAQRAAPPPHLVNANCARSDVLMKVMDTAEQHTLDRSKRLANLRAAFAVNPAALPAMQGKSVLLVDDVMTTGATMHLAARTLLNAGAASVTGAVFARTPAPEVS